MVRERLVQIVENLAPTPVAWIAIAVGLFVHGVGFFLFRVELPGFLDVQVSEPYVSFIKLDASEDHRNLRDQALLSDSVPLFLPSEYDFGWKLLQPETYLDNQNPRMLSPFSWNASLNAQDILKPVALEAELLDPSVLLEGELWHTFHTLGERAQPVSSGTERFAVMVFEPEAGREEVARFLYAENPINVDLSNILWRPVEVLVWVSTEGSLGSPILQESSGISALDQFAMQEAQRIANLRWIPQGYYRVTLGP